MGLSMRLNEWTEIEEDANLSLFSVLNSFVESELKMAGGIEIKYFWKKYRK